jgi:hypothetical protein
MNDLIPGAKVIDETADLTVMDFMAGPALFIPMSFFAATGMNDAVNLENPEAVIAAIIKNVAVWYKNDTTEQPNIEVDQPRESVITRDSEQKYAFSYGITFYQDFTAPTLDPDMVAAS